MAVEDEDGDDEGAQKEHGYVHAYLPLSLPLPVVYCAAKVGGWHDMILF